MSRSASPRRDPKTGTWWFVVDLPAGPYGHRRQAKRRGFRTKAEALAALDELRVASRQGTYVAPAGQTVAEFLYEDWLPTVRHRLAESTWVSYERNIRHHVVPTIGFVQLRALDDAVRSHRVPLNAADQATPPSAKAAKAPEMDVKVVSERLGHTSPLITWQTYQHVVKGMQSDAAERVAELIFDARS